MPKVLMSIGIPGAGKTTYWKKFIKANGAIYASPDAVREEMLGDYRYRTHEQNLEVWDRIFAGVKQALAESKDVVIDGAYVERHYRREDIALYRQWGADKIIGYWFKTPLEVALERNRGRNKPLPDDVLEQANRRLQSEKPNLEDGFDEIRVIEAA